MFFQDTTTLNRPGLARLIRTLLIGLVILTGSFSPAAAADSDDDTTSGQADASPRLSAPTLAVGAAIALFQPTDDNTGRSVRVQPVVRFERRSGLGPAVEFNWFSTDLTTAIAGEQSPLGRLRVRPIMAGICYRVPRGPVSILFSVLGGYAFNAAEIDDQARAMFLSRRQVTATALEVDNSPALSAGVSIWYGLSSRVGLVGSAGYLFTRPDVTVVTSDGRQTTTWKADSVVVKAGLAFKIF